ncbi:MAG: trehalose-6-phosphate synthase, partial [Acidobacteria bacterium]|nr:trehalose-6-phosphate synthase [Acidobacteriota bacterium]
MKRGRMPTAGRLIVVSNRLPFTARESEGGLEFTPSVGGLATGLASYRETLQERPQGPRRFLWVGWPGSTVSQERQREVRARSLAEFSAVPVFLSEAEIDKFYQGFCNKTIWPLFHCFQVYTNYDEEHWKRYVEVNRTFCRTLAGLLRPGDTLWIHDYHLMLLPGMIREIAPAATIGFFLHIPFPNYELFRLLPSRWRRDILKGLLGADLVGFHTNDYRQDFLKCVLRILGHDSQIGELLVGDRVVRAEAFPMGIDYAKYRDGAGAPEVRAESLDLRRRMDGARIILSIDRLDYTKGIVNRLEGFETFL